MFFAFRCSPTSYTTSTETSFIVSVRMIWKSSLPCLTLSIIVKFLKVRVNMSLRLALIIISSWCYKSKLIGVSPDKPAWGPTNWVVLLVRTGLNCKQLILLPLHRVGLSPDCLYKYMGKTQPLQYHKMVFLHLAIKSRALPRNAATFTLC